MGTRLDLSPFGVWQLFRLGCSAYQDIGLRFNSWTRRGWIWMKLQRLLAWRCVRTKAVQCPCLWAGEGTLSSCRLWSSGWYKISSGNSVGGCPRRRSNQYFENFYLPIPKCSFATPSDTRYAPSISILVLQISPIILKKADSWCP